MRLFDRAVSNAIYLSISWTILTLAGFVFWISAGKLLTPEEYGIALTAINLTIFITNIITLGLPTAVSKLLPEYLRKKKHTEIKSLVTTSTLVILVSSLIVLTIIFMKIQFFSSLLKIPVVVMQISIISVVLMSFSLLFGSVLYASYQLKRYVISDLFYSLTKVFVSILVILLGYKFFGPILGFTTGLLFWFFFRIPGQYLSFNKNHIKNGELFKYALPGLMSTLIFALVSNTQYITLSIIKTSAITGVFGVGLIISTFLGIIPGILNTAIFPIISGLSAEKNMKNIQRRFVSYIVRYTIFFSAPLIFIFTLFSKHFILLFSTKEYLSASSLLPFLSVASLLFGLSNIFSNAIYALKRPDIYRNILLIVSAIFLILTPALTYFKGDFGITIGYLITMIIYFFISFYYLRKVLFITFPFKDLVKISISSIVAFSLLYFSRPIVPNIFLGMPVAIISSIIYVIILLKMKFYRPEDIRIIMFLEKKFKILGKPLKFIANIIQRNSD